MKRIERFDWRETAAEHNVTSAEQRKKRPLYGKLLWLFEEEVAGKYYDIGERRAKVQLAREIFRAYHKNKKAEYSSEIYFTVKTLLGLFPRELLVKAQRRLRANAQTPLASRLIDRIAIVPAEKYGQVEFVLSGQTENKNSTLGYHYRGMSFVNEVTLKRKGVLPTTAHEITHLLEHICGTWRRGAESEIMAEAIARYVQALASQKQRKKAIALARTNYVSKEMPPDYCAGINQGRKVFLQAEELRQQQGPGSAQVFFQELFKAKELTINEIRRAYLKASDLE